MGRKKTKIQVPNPKDVGNPFSASLVMVSLERDKSLPRLKVNFEIFHRTNCPEGTEINENITLTFSDSYKYDFEIDPERRIIEASFPLKVEDKTAKGAMMKLSRFIRRISEALSALEKNGAFENLESEFFSRSVKEKKRKMRKTGINDIGKLLFPVTPLPNETKVHHMTEEKREYKLTPKQMKVLKDIKEGISPVFRDRWKERGYRITTEWLEANGWIEKKNEKYVLTDKSKIVFKEKDNTKKSIDNGNYSWSGVPDKYNPGKNKVVHYVDKNGKAICNAGRSDGGRNYDVDRDGLFKNLPRCTACTIKVNRTTLT